MKSRTVRMTLALVLLALWASACGTARPRVITLAGSSEGYADGSGSIAQFSGPLDVAVDAQGNVYVADSANHRIRKVAPDGTIVTLAGNDQVIPVDGPLSEAVFSTPTGIAFAASGALYVADSAMKDPHPMRVRVITPAGMVTTLAGSGQAGYVDGVGLDAQFKSPASLAVDQAGNVYVADTTNNRIRKIAPDGTVTTLAGPTETGYAAGYADGPASQALFQGPRSVDVDGAGNVYVADTGNHCIRVISPGGQVTTLAGTWEPGYADGQGAVARFNFPSGIAVDAQGNLYVADTANHRIRKITPDGATSFIVTTLAGSGTAGNANGLASEARFRAPEGVAVDSAGNVYVADTGNHRIRKIVVRGGQ